MIEFTELKGNELMNIERRRRRRAKWNSFLGAVIALGLFTVSMLFLGVCIVLSMIRINIF